jgi:hypothetical protein
VREGLWSALGRKNRRLFPGDIEHILKHEFYAGWFTWRDEQYRGKHETVFTADEWARLQETFGKRAPYRSPLDKAGALSGCMTCVECGCLITYDPKLKSSGRGYDYYRCSNGHRVHTKRVRVTEVAPGLKIFFETSCAKVERQSRDPQHGSRRDGDTEWPRSRSLPRRIDSEWRRAHRPAPSRFASW